MKKSNIINLVDPSKLAANNFAAHVQNIAFNLTLSRTMISVLRVVRDYGFPDGNYTYDDGYDGWATVSNGSHQGIMMFKALERRGLIVHHEPNYKMESGRQVRCGDGKKLFTLSKAGDLVCQLLVEAGLLSEPQPFKAKKTA